MSQITCPKCGAEHDGSMDANGWATCKSCVHLWNLKAELAGAEPANAPKQQPLKKDSLQREKSGYFPDDNAPAKTAALTRREVSGQQQALPDDKAPGRQDSPIGALDSQPSDGELELPVNSTMVKVDGESADSSGDIEGFPDMRTRVSDNLDSENAINCPVCGASFENNHPDDDDVHCPHCDTTFNVNTGRYQVSTSKDNDPSGRQESYVGRVIGGCKIGQKLGEGGMGSVYHAKQLSLDRDVALKILPPELTSQSNFMKRFQQEARSLARINHSNIIGIYEFGEDSDTKLHYMMMEFVDGEDLADLLRRRHHLTEIETLDILKQSSLGLEQAALKGIIHRDIKPDNIMITEGGTCKVSDFGLAKNVASDSTMTNASIRVGTPAFMSPEQCDGLRLDFRSDIYSLGVTAYVMLTGHLPYNGESPFAIMLKHKSDPIPSVRESMGHVNPAVDALVARMMAKEPEKRFSSWRVMREELDSVIEQVAGKTQSFPADAVPSADLPTQVTNLNPDADPAEDVSAMMKGLGQLDRSDGDHPPLRSQSKELEMIDAESQQSAPAVSGVPQGAVPLPADAAPVAPTAQPANPAVPPAPPQQPPAAPPLDLQLSDPAPPPPSRQPTPEADQSGAQQTALPPGVTPTQGPGTATGPTQRSSGSAPLASQSSSTRRARSTSARRKSLEDAKTEQQSRVTAYRSQAEKLFEAGKLRKAIGSWQRAAQETTDVSTRDACFQKIQMARFLMKRRMKRRAAISALLLVPILWAAVYICTPFAHNYYIQEQLKEISALSSEEMREHRMQQLAKFARPFKWYEQVCLGMSYEVQKAGELEPFLQEDEQLERPEKQAVQAVDLSELHEAVRDASVSWQTLLQHCEQLSSEVTTPEDRKLLQDIQQNAQKHIQDIKDTRTLIDEKIRQARFAAAEDLARQLKVQEPRGGELLKGLPTQVILSVENEGGKPVNEPAVLLNGVRLRDYKSVYSLDDAPVKLEIRHPEYQVYSGEIPAGQDGTFTVTLQADVLWTLDTGLVNCEWVDMVDWGKNRLIINSPGNLKIIDLLVGKEIASLKRSDVNIPPGQGASEWSNALQVQHEQILLGSRDGLLLSLDLSRDKKLQLDRALYRGNHSVLGSIEFDMVFRSGKTRALLLRKGGDSVSLIGLINNSEEWRQSGLTGKINPVLLFRNDRLFVIDDVRFREFEEDGTKRDALQLLRPRSGVTAWADQDVLAVPHAQGIDLIIFADNVYRARAGMAVDGQLVGGLTRRGTLIHAAFDDGTLRAFSYANGALVEQWRFTCPSGHFAGTMPSVRDDVLSFADQNGNVYCLDARRGNKLRTLEMATPLVHPPVIAGDTLLSLDKGGLLSAYKAAQP